MTDPIENGLKVETTPDGTGLLATISVPEDSTPEDIERTAKGIADALSAEHKRRGGVGLVIEKVTDLGVDPAD